MIVTGEATFTSLNNGTSRKTGKPWFSAKFLDSGAEEYATLFISEELYNELQEIPTHTPVLLTLNLSMSSRYFRLASIEPIETR